SQPSRPIPLRQKNCLTDIPRGPYKVENSHPHCPKSAPWRLIGPVTASRTRNSAGEDNPRRSAGQSRDLLLRQKRRQPSGRAAGKQNDHGLSLTAQPFRKTSSNLPVDTA